MLYSRMFVKLFENNYVDDMTMVTLSIRQMRTSFLAMDSNKNTTNDACSLEAAYNDKPIIGH